MGFSCYNVKVKKITKEKMNNENKSANKLEKLSFYLFLATTVLAPVVFWANPFITQDLIKTFVIAIGIIASAILVGFVFMKEKRVPFLPKSLCMTSVLLIISVVISSFLSVHLAKSFFGQGFEIANASFILIIFLAGYLAYSMVLRQKDRAVVLYVGLVTSYIIAFIVHLLRAIFGPKFMTLGILNTATSSIVGSWYNFSTYSAIILIVVTLAIIFLNLSKKMKIVYWILFAISAIGVLFSADTRIWDMLTLTFFALTLFTFVSNWKNVRTSGLGFIISLKRSIPLFLLILFIVSLVFVYKGKSTIGPVIDRVGLNYAELNLPWQMTLGVTSSVLQNYPLFGVGSNNFGQAYFAYKPIQINNTSVWSAEFSTGFGLIPTFVATHGLIGSMLWIILFVFFGIISTRILRNLPSEPDKKFMLVSSFAVSVYIWLVSLISVPSHTILLFAFVFTGIFLGFATSIGLLASREYVPLAGTKMNKLFSSFVSLIVLVLVVWGLVYIKNTLAFYYFGSGVEILSVTGDVEKADRAISKAIKIDNSDSYWRGKAEIALVASQKLAGTINPSSSASTTQAVLTQINGILNKGLADAKNATSYDPANYYNYLSEARISEVAANIKMQNGYENAVNSYNLASNINPFNPSIYLSLANLQARQSKYDEALQSLGKALQVKNNYLEAIFLLSQIYAAKGDINNAIVAAKVAVELNPQNSVLQFQLGLLQYNNKDYNGAIKSLGDAIKYQPDYANAKYFLGLSEARLNNPAKAIVQFEDLAKTNPENQEVALILSNLRAGKSIFTDAKAPVTTAPEKRTSLPIKEKR